MVFFSFISLSLQLADGPYFGSGWKPWSKKSRERWGPVLVGPTLTRLLRSEPLSRLIRFRFSPIIWVPHLNSPNQNRTMPWHVFIGQRSYMQPLVTAASSNYYYPSICEKKKESAYDNTTPEDFVTYGCWNWQAQMLSLPERSAYLEHILLVFFCFFLLLFFFFISFPLKF